MKERWSQLLLVGLTIGCATPAKYYPGTDAGTAASLDGATVAADGPPPLISPAMPDVAADLAADVAAHDLAVDPAPDLPLSPDVPALLANGERCSTGGVCRSGQCIDEICCSRPCGACERCVAPGGTCQSIPADEPDNSPPGTCSGTRSCDGQNRCVECTKCTDGKCISRQWNFESGTLEGATVDPGVYAQSPGVALAPVYLGKQSLAMVVPVKYYDQGDFYTRFQVCAGAAKSQLRNHTFRARVFVEANEPGPFSPFQLTLYSDQQVDAITRVSYPAGSWIVLEGKLPAIEDGNVTDLILSVSSMSTAMWVGRVWVDDVRIE